MESAVSTVLPSAGAIFVLKHVAAIRGQVAKAFKQLRRASRTSTLSGTLALHGTIYIYILALPAVKDLAHRIHTTDSTPPSRLGPGLLTTRDCHARDGCLSSRILQEVGMQLVRHHGPMGYSRSLERPRPSFGSQGAVQRGIQCGCIAPCM
eukprot:scaffold2858_cov659-Pavlova_lutheri.AAC.19